MATARCRSACYSSVLDSVYEQLAIVRASNASTATAVLSRSEARLRQRRMRAQLRLVDHGPVVVVTYDFERIRNASRCARSCASSSFRGVALREPSTVAVTLTHVAVHEALLRVPSVERALVLEDDVLVGSDALRTQLRCVLEALEALEALSPPHGRSGLGWAYVSLGCAPVRTAKPACGLRRGLQPCSRAYLVSRIGMRRICSHALPMQSPIDYAMIPAFDGEPRVFHLKGSPIAHGSHIHRCKRGADF